MKAKSENKTIMRRYYVQTYVLYVAYFALTAFWFIFLKQKWFALLLTVFTGFFVRVLHRRIMLCKFDRILYQELDPEKLRNVFACSPRFVIPIAYRLPLELNTGEYQVLVNLCYALLKAEKKPYKKIIYLTYLARVYFETDDREKLEKVCEWFDLYFKQAKKNSYMQRTVGVFRFYRCYVEEKYEACLALLEEAKLLFDTKALDALLWTVRCDYDFARIYARLGENQQATALWKGVCDRAPKLYIARLASAQLGTIETGAETTPLIKEYLPSKNDEVSVKILASQSKHQKRSKWLCGLTILLAFFMPMIVSKDVIKMQILNSALTQQYESYSILTNTTLNFSSGDQIEVFLVSADGGIHLVGFEQAVLPKINTYQENLEKRMWYTTKVFNNPDLEFSFIVWDEKEYLFSQKNFVLDGKEMCFCWITDS